MEHHAGRGYRAVVGGRHRCACVARRIRGVELVGMHRNPRLPVAAYPQYNACVLDPTVGIEQPGSYGADLRPLSMLEHRFQPSAGDHLRVVVEEKYVLYRGLGDGEVVDPRVVERFPKRDYPVRYRSEVFE